MASSSSNSNFPETATNYDVFLSFRGEDTRKGFTSYLHDALIQQGYKTFFDNENLQRGKAISDGLLKAIEGSRSSIVVLSENFAFSSWCLIELAKIVECMESKGLTVLPIFYHVDPSIIRHESENYREAFKKHENNPELNRMEVKNWRDALKVVVGVAGWTLNKSDVEPEFIKNFIAEISSMPDIQKRPSILETKKSKDMGPNVFGKAITDSTLQEMPEYIDKEITATDRSHVALKMKDADKKVVNARTFLKSLNWRHGNSVSTLCLIYNATGGTLEYAGGQNWSGHMVRESPYPEKIENGQWVAFLHVHDRGAASGSIAAIVYRGKNAKGTWCEWMLSWYNSWDYNRAYTEIREDGHYARNYWTYILSLLENKGLDFTDTWDGCVSSVTTTGGSTSPIFKGVMQLVNA